MRLLTRIHITKLLGPAKWTYFHLYVILDIFRWDETAGLAKRIKMFATHSKCKRRPANEEG